MAETSMMRLESFLVNRFPNIKYKSSVSKFTACSLGLLILVKCATPFQIHRDNKSVQVWQTQASKGQYLQRMDGVRFRPGRSSNFTKIEVDDAKRYQRIEGYGAALTDSSAWLLHGLPRRQQHKLLLALFAKTHGIGLNYIRISIGASDFSRQPYTYHDREDTELRHFGITSEQQYVIAMIKKIVRINPAIKILASPWSPPAWMKTPAQLKGGKFNSKYNQVYANYLTKFIQAYRAEGIFIDALTLQNEPNYSTADYPSAIMTPQQQAQLAVALGETFQKNDIQTQIFIWDHNWDEPQAAMEILSDPVASRFIAGSAWHGYAGSPDTQSLVHHAFPTKKIYFTEITGTQAYTDADQNLVWSLHYVVIGAMKHWAQTVMYWNLLLDKNHGPNMLPPSADPDEHLRGLVQLRGGREPFDFQIEYFALGHVSKFITPASIRIFTATIEQDKELSPQPTPGPLSNLESVAFLTPEGRRVLLVLNPNPSHRRYFDVQWQDRYFSFSLEPQSAASFIW